MGSSGDQWVSPPPRVANRLWMPQPLPHPAHRCGRSNRWASPWLPNNGLPRKLSTRSNRGWCLVGSMGGSRPCAVGYSNAVTHSFLPARPMNPFGCAADLFSTARPAGGCCGQGGGPFGRHQPGGDHAGQRGEGDRREPPGQHARQPLVAADDQPQPRSGHPEPDERYRVSTLR